MKRIVKKIVSVFISFALMLQVVCMEGLFNGSVIASSYVNGKATVTLGDIDVNIADKLEDNGDGTYSLTVDLSTALTANDMSTNRLVSEDGYFVAPIAGRYFVEIWGGSGAEGGNSIEYNPKFTGILGKGGASGAGGHVYGIVTLQRGDVLWYEVGGNGAQENSMMSGGGANAGGDSIISFKTGGGGGYSAVYKIPGSSFKTNYLDSNGNLAVTKLSADDHNSSYIFIAGGGGGGGAGCLYHASAKAVAAPDGGAGGSFSSSTATLSGPVAGTVYCGGNGTSSGTNTSYIGIGGSYVPGESPAAKHGWMQTISPNNWSGTATTGEYGAGGSSNLRGGGGGAGYAGGSGGIMTSLSVSTNVGGGGGGSSFVASSVSSADSSMLLPDGNPSDNGGAVYINYLDQSSHDEYNDTTLSFTASEYFDVSSSSSGVEINGSEVTFSPIQLLEEGSSSATFTFTPKSNFLGGNMVPLFDGELVLSTESPAHDVSMTLSDDCSYVNVPISYDSLETHNLTYDSDSIPDTIPFSSLFTSVDTSGFPAGTDQLIDMASSFVYSVKKAGVAESDPISAGTGYDSSVYAITYEIVPFNSKVAKIGTVATTQRVTKSASVTINDVSIFELSSTGGGKGGAIGDGNDDGIGMYITKTLTYENEDYILGLNAQVSKDYVYTSFTSQTYSSPSSYDFVAPASGYYAIQTWGAYGANGGDARSYDGNRTTQGGDGGAGAYVCGYAYLNCGDSVTVLIGSSSDEPSLVQATKDNDRIALGIGGAGGGYSAVAVNSTYVTVAGGGGGGGGATIGYRALTWESGSSGDSASINRNVTSADTAIDSSHVATSGEDGYTGTLGAAKEADGGSAGYTYVGLSTNSSALPSSVSAIYSSMKSSDKPSAAGKNGACVITLLQSDDAIMTNDIFSIISSDFSGYYVSYNLSKYYDAGSIYVDTVVGESIEYSSYTKSTNSDGSTYINLQGLSPAYSLKQHDTSVENRYKVEVNVNADFELHFKPKSAFLGGNDVPVLVCGVNGLADGMIFGHNDYYANVPQQAITDYANVALNTDAFSDFEGKDKTIIMGDSVSNSTLFPDMSIMEDPQDWTGDYVTVTCLDNSGSVSPSETTTYTREIKIEADSEPTNAVVIDAVTSETLNRSATVTVQLSVNYDGLENLTSLSGNPTVIDVNETLTVGLGTEEGYEYPDTVTVKVGGSTLDSSKYSYDSSKGTIIVPAEQVIGNIEIIASGVKKTYKVYFAYQEYDGKEFSDVSPTGWPKEFCEGDSIQSVVNATSITPSPAPGYRFEWTWTTEDGKQPDPAVMPARDLYVVGTYTAETYKLVINYYYEGTTDPVCDAYVNEYMRYEMEYNVESPKVSGWVPSSAVVSGKIDDTAVGSMTDNTLTINVYYEQIEKELVVQFVAADGKTLYSNGTELTEYRSGLIASGDPYEYTVPTVTGYTPDVEVISGNMTDDGVYEIVTYSPNSYQLTLDPDGGDIGSASTTRVVKYNDIYSHVFNPSDGTDSYVALPIPVKEGYIFTGWYLDTTTITSSSTPVESDTVVEPVSDLTDMSSHTLKAGWEVIKVTVTINYVYEPLDPTGTPEAALTPAVYNDVAYTDIEDYESPVYVSTSPAAYPELEGYHPDKTSIHVEKLVEDYTETVTYLRNEYTLTIHYQDREGNTLYPDFTDTVKYKDSYSKTSPLPEEVEGDMKKCLDQTVDIDSMPAHNVEVTVLYTKNSSDYCVTVEWGAMEFDCHFDAENWDPESHTYKDSEEQSSNDAEFTPTTPNNNYIKVTNESEYPVSVKLVFEAEARFKNVTGSFTSTNGEFDLDAIDEHTEYLDLQGPLYDRFVNKNEPGGKAECGKCSVTISGR